MSQQMRRQFDQAAKARIMKAEVAKYGYVRAGSFASEVQRKVDLQGAKQKPALGIARTK